MTRTQAVDVYSKEGTLLRRTKLGTRKREGCFVIVRERWNVEGHVGGRLINPPVVLSSLLIFSVN